MRRERRNDRSWPEGLIAQGLRNLQGMRAEAVRPMLESLVTKFEQLASSVPDDPASQASRAAMLDEFGNAYFALGDFHQALKAYRDGLDIRERRVAAERNDKDAQHALSVSHYNVGEALRAQGYLDDARSVAFVRKDRRHGLQIRSGAGIQIWAAMCGRRDCVRNPTDCGQDSDGSRTAFR